MGSICTVYNQSSNWNVTIWSKMVTLEDICKWKKDVKWHVCTVSLPSYRGHREPRRGLLGNRMGLREKGWAVATKTKLKRSSVIVQHDRMTIIHNLLHILSMSKLECLWTYHEKGSINYAIFWLPSTIVYKYWNILCLIDMYNCLNQNKF